MTQAWRELHAVEQQVLQQFPDDQPGGGECRSIMQRWFARLRKQINSEAEPDEQQDSYDRLLGEAVNILESIRTGIGALCWLDEVTLDIKRKRFSLWSWPTDADVLKWAAKGPGRAQVDDLDSALVDYLKRPWLQDDAIDASSINALLFAQFVEFVDTVQTGAAVGKANWSYIFAGGNILAQFGLAVAAKVFRFLAWCLLPALALGFLIYNHETAGLIALGLWGAYVIYRLVIIPFRWRERKAREKRIQVVNERLTAMSKAWHAA